MEVLNPDLEDADWVSWAAEHMDRNNDDPVRRHILRCLMFALEWGLPLTAPLRALVQTNESAARAFRHLQEI